MRKIRMVCMECNRVTDLPERKADGKRCECGGALFPLGWVDELHDGRAGVSPRGVVRKIGTIRDTDAPPPNTQNLRNENFGSRGRK